MSDVPFPRLDSFFSVAREIWEQRTDLQERFGQVESLGYWTWLMTEGFGSDPRLIELMPIPPVQLTGRVVASQDQLVFLESGISDAHNLLEALRSAGFDPGAGGRLLDFGCGCGRILRVLSRFADSTEIHGADVDEKAIQWCRKHLDFAEFETLDELPPTPYANGFFDGLYCCSVFSHLPRSRHHSWLEELARITAPGAALVITLQGLCCFDLFLTGEAAPGGLPPSDQLRRDRVGLVDTGFLYYPYEAGRPWEDEDAGNEAYGQAFVLESYVRAHWLDHFELVGFIEAPQRWQDYVLLVRR